MDRSLFERVVQFDQSRKSIPGEHWLTLAAGLWFLRRKSNSIPSTLLSKSIGAALLVRAATGRDGLQKLWKDGSETIPAARGWATRDQEAGLPAPAGMGSRAALLQSPEAGGREGLVEGSSQARAGGFPDYR